MSHINISNIIVCSNPSTFLSPFRFSITFECLQPIKEEIEWKVIYVGSPKDETYDQVLDSFCVGPFTEPSVMQFEIEPPAPDCSKIPTEDMLGVSAIIHSVSYQKQEFFRVGYFVYNNYEDPFLLENPYPIQIDRIARNILSDKPRIIRNTIDWESQTTEKLKAINDIIMENSGIINNDTTIQFKGMFSDLGMNEGQTKTDEFNGFNWGNNNSNGGFGFPSGKENFSEGLGSQGKMFGEGSQDNQQYNANCFMNPNNGGFNASQPSCFAPAATNEGFMGLNTRNNHFGNSFF